MYPDSIFENCKQVSRRCILTKEHKAAVLEFIDANLSAAVVKVTKHLLKRFSDLKFSRSTVYNFIWNGTPIHRHIPAVQLFTIKATKQQPKQKDQQQPKMEPQLKLILREKWGFFSGFKSLLFFFSQCLIVPLDILPFLSFSVLQTRLVLLVYF